MRFLTAGLALCFLLLLSSCASHRPTCGPGRNGHASKCESCVMQPTPPYYGYFPTCWRQWPPGWGCHPDGYEGLLSPEEMQRGEFIIPAPEPESWQVDPGEIQPPQPPRPPQQLPSPNDDSPVAPEADETPLPRAHPQTIQPTTAGPIVRRANLIRDLLGEPSR